MLQEVSGLSVAGPRRPAGLPWCIGRSRSAEGAKTHPPCDLAPLARTVNASGMGGMGRAERC